MTTTAGPIAFRRKPQAGQSGSAPSDCVIPASARASTRFGVIAMTPEKSALTSASESAGAGAGFRIVNIPASQPRFRARLAVSSGTSRLASSTSSVAEQRGREPVDVLRSQPMIGPRRNADQVLAMIVHEDQGHARRDPFDDPDMTDVDPLAPIELQRLAAQFIIADGRDEDDLGARTAGRDRLVSPLAAGRRRERAAQDRLPRRRQPRHPHGHVRVARSDDDDTGHGILPAFSVQFSAFGKKRLYKSW